MPELPEIETVKLQLTNVLVGQTVTHIEKLHPKSLQGDPKLVIGKKVESIERMGKMLVINMTGKYELAIHFKMSGQLIFVTRDQKHETRVVGGHPTEDWVGALPSKHTRVVFHFKSGDTMYFNDQRIFGWVKILTFDQLQQMPFVKKLGPEVWDISDAQFYDLMRHKKKAIKVALMDQDLLSGIGNIYANDALWEARIHPKRIANTLTKTEAKKLREKLILVLKEGIKYGGATASDAKYIDLHGLGGTYQEHFRVYDRTNKPCLRCKTTIHKITLAGRGTYFCPRCQR
ncbi:bifunctional DNA-formamidopyrimidine glycosylase/DNA-(apurinic or apyrimidinic site) lyase [Candidatus Microgenomates bacterium]|nr:MAG: bifunctional DNA-formamidopyrimidine glycosylase/DNA-(apurinic or apyrimidinic site) lyase [Candidatus Microgenomates bacterium]